MSKDWYNSQAELPNGYKHTIWCRHSNTLLSMWDISNGIEVKGSFDLWKYVAWFHMEFIYKKRIFSSVMGQKSGSSYHNHLGIGG